VAHEAEREGAPVPNLRIHPTGEVVYLEPGDTILGGLFKAGYAYTVGCRRGGCAICKVDLLEGEFAYNRPVADSVITEEESTDGTCRSCRAVPASDVTIEMRDSCLRLVNPFLRQINEKARLSAEVLAAGTTNKE
jgi:CDP-4-dehydro-6-deoxyglucose reductase